jgi:hypothetical protein
MVGDAVWEGGADVFDVETVDEQFRELKDAGEQGLYVGEEGRVVFRFSHHDVVLAHHGDAGGGGDADGFGVAEDIDEATDERDGLAVVAGVVVHLAAAGLGEGEVDGVAEALQEARDGDARLWEQGVVVAGDEESDAQERSSEVGLVDVQVAAVADDHCRSYEQGKAAGNE